MDTRHWDGVHRDDFDRAAGVALGHSWVWPAGPSLALVAGAEGVAALVLGKWGVRRYDLGPFGQPGDELRVEVTPGRVRVRCNGRVVRVWRRWGPRPPHRRRC